MMKRHLKRSRGFTLIELLTVIAIIGILAGILIPTVGAVRKQAKIAASKSQLNQYVNAIQMFKGEYGYYPLATGTADSNEIDLGSTAQSTRFIQTLSGRDIDGSPISDADATTTGNRRKIAFHSFAETEFLFNPATDSYTTNQLADRFDNVNINIVIDTNGDGFVAPAGPDAGEGRIRTPVTAYVDADNSIGAPAYKLWD